MKKYFIIHGSFSNPFANWFPYLENEIEKTKPAEMEEPICYVPQFPTGVGFQNYENWERVMDCYDIAKFDEMTIFAHSIAPAFVCKYLIKHQIKVKKLVFVCGFNNYLGVNEAYDSVNKSMFSDDIEKIKNYAEEIICLYADNDPYVKYDAEKDFADKVATKQIIVKGGGHLNKAFGYEQFQKLKEFI